MYLYNAYHAIWNEAILLSTEPFKTFEKFVILPEKKNLVLCDKRISCLVFISPKDFI